MSAPAFELAEHRRERNESLERQNERLRDERLRLERLLGLACRAAVAGTGFDEMQFLAALCELEATNPARPAYLERRERQEAEARLEHIVQVLRETA